MDYQELAWELLESMPKLSKTLIQKNADRFARGEMSTLVFLSCHDAASPGEISGENGHQHRSYGEALGHTCI